MRKPFSHVLLAKVETFLVKHLYCLCCVSELPSLVGTGLVWSGLSLVVLGKNVVFFSRCLDS